MLWIFIGNNMRKSIGRNISKIMNCKYRKNLLDSAKKVINAQKTASNRGIQKTL